MTATIEKIPHGARAITPYITCKGAARAIDFYVRAFGARETSRLADPSGVIGHAEIEICGSPLMLSDEHPQIQVVSPETLGGTPFSIHLYVENIDAFVARAAAEGATIRRPLQDQFYGHRTAVLVDPFGHVWHVAERIEDLTEAEIEKRYQELMKQA